jgi:hypothetical protein
MLDRLLDVYRFWGTNDVSTRDDDINAHGYRDQYERCSFVLETPIWWIAGTIS